MSKYIDIYTKSHNSNNFAIPNFLRNYFLYMIFFLIRIEFVYEINKVY